MRRAAVLVLCGLVLAGPHPGAGAAVPGAQQAARRGADYIASHQQGNGAFFSAEAPADVTALAVFALVSGGVTGEAVDRALDHVADKGPARAAERAGYAGRIAVGVRAAGRDPRAFGGHDYVAAVHGHHGASGAYDENLFAHSLALLGLAAGGAPAPDDAIRHVRTNQCASGGFGWMVGCARGADTDTTAVVVQALAAHGFGPTDLAVSRARSWLAGARNDEGGFGQAEQDATNANSTGLALSAIAALDEDPAAAPWGEAGGPNPVEALMGLQDASGAFRWTAADTKVNDYATVEAVPGLAGQAPIFPALKRSKEPDGSTTEDPADTGGASVGRRSATNPSQRKAAGSEPGPATLVPGDPQTPGDAETDATAGDATTGGEGSRDERAFGRPIETAPSRPLVALVGLAASLLSVSAGVLLYRRLWGASMLPLWLQWKRPSGSASSSNGSTPAGSSPARTSKRIPPPRSSDRSP